MSHKSIWTDLQGIEFSQGFVNANGITTRYLHSGKRSNPSLIFLHGTGGHAEAYVRNLDAHGRHFDTWAIDMLGHGYTTKPDYDYEIARYVDHLADFMDALDIKTASFSGESLGGWVAGAFAVRYPERVDRLVLNTAGAERVRPDALSALRASTLEAVLDPVWDRIRDRLQWLMFYKSDVHDDLIASRQAIYCRPDMKAHIENLLCLHTMEARQKYAVTAEQWKSIKAPTLVLWTSDDPTAAVSVGQDLANLIPGSRFVVMDKCGHWPQFENAAVFNEIHVDFLLGR